MSADGTPHEPTDAAANAKAYWTADGAAFGTA